ncbi:O-antigen ligase family protein [Patescibacteria group bacterium]|nr:O-antigen ligase family protein [Patescibacteria group bacterium]
MENILDFKRFKLSRENLVLGFTLLFSLLYVLGIIFGIQAEFFYLFLLIFMMLFILQDYMVGLLVLIFMTMVFERFFTLAPLEFFDAVYKIYPLDFVVIFSAVSFFLKEIVGNKRKIKLGYLGIPLLIFGGFCFFSMLYGLATGGEFEKAFSSFKNYFVYAIIYFLVINFLRSKADLYRLLKVFLVSSLAVLLFAFIGIIRGEGLWVDITPLSTEGSRLIAPTHAFYLGIAVLFILSLYASGKKVFGRLTLPILVLQGVAILISLSRHLWIALAFAIFFLFLFVKREQKKKLFKTSLILLFVTVVVLVSVVWLQTLLHSANISIIPLNYLANFSERFTSIDIFSSDDPSGMWRVFVWRESFEVLSQNIVTGTGFGKTITFDFYGYPLIVELRSLHNGFLGIAVQMGILGFLSFVAVNVVAWYMFLKNFQKQAGTLGAIFMGAFSAYLYFLVCANFGVYFELNLLLIFFWLVLGIFEVALRLMKEEAHKGPQIELSKHIKKEVA